MPKTNRPDQEVLVEQTGRPGHDPLLEANMVDRLKRVEGQVRGIQKMIREHRSCSEVITQLAAVRAAVNRVSLSVLTCHLAEGIAKDIEDGKDFRESLSESMAVFKRFS